MQIPTFLLVLAALILVVGTVIAVVRVHNARESEKGIPFVPAFDESDSGDLLSFAEGLAAAERRNREPMVTGELESAA
jgi:hypothetical protein